MSPKIKKNIASNLLKKIPPFKKRPGLWGYYGVFIYLSLAWFAYGISCFSYGGIPFSVLSTKGKSVIGHVTWMGNSGWGADKNVDLRIEGESTVFRIPAGVSEEDPENLVRVGDQVHVVTTGQYPFVLGLVKIEGGNRPVLLDEQTSRDRLRPLLEELPTKGWLAIFLGVLFLALAPGGHWAWIRFQKP